MKKTAIIIFLIFSKLASAQTEFADGYYFDSNGQKKSCTLKLNRAGFSAFNETPTSITIINEEGKKEKKTLDEIKGFVIQKDSFSIIKKFKINWVRGEYERDFAQVIENGKINLYKHFSTSYDGQTRYWYERYVLNINGTDEYFGIYDRVEHKPYLINILTANETLKSELLNLDKKEWIEEIPRIIREYNTWYEEDGKSLENSINGNIVVLRIKKKQSDKSILLKSEGKEYSLSIYQKQVLALPINNPSEICVSTPDQNQCIKVAPVKNIDKYYLASLDKDNVLTLNQVEKDFAEFYINIIDAREKKK